MAQAPRSLAAFWIGGAGGAVHPSGRKSLLASWITGAGKPPSAGVGVKSLLAVWSGGAGSLATPPAGSKSLAAFWVGGAGIQHDIPTMSLVMTLYDPTVVVPVSPPTVALSLSTLAPSFAHTSDIYDIGSVDIGYIHRWTGSGSGLVGVKSRTVNSTVAFILSSASVKFKGRVTGSTLGLSLGTASVKFREIVRTSNIDLLLGLSSTAIAGELTGRIVNSTVSLNFNILSNISAYKFYNTGSSKYLRSGRRDSLPSQNYSRG